MADNVHKKERRAVTVLRKGVARYAEDLRKSIQHARREAAAIDEEMQVTLDRRRIHLARADQQLEELQRSAHLASGSERAELERLAMSARRRQADAARQLENARQAAKMLRQSRSELLKVATNVEGKVIGQSSAAASALARLDDKIGEYWHAPNPFQISMVVIAVTANGLSDAKTVTQTTGDFAKSVGVNHIVVDAVRHQNYKEYAADGAQSVFDYYATQRLSMDKRKSGRGRDGTG